MINLESSLDPKQLDILGDAFDNEAKVRAKYAELEGALNESRESLLNLSLGALAKISRQGQGTLLERAAYSAAVDYGNPATSLDEFEQRARLAHSKFTRLDEALREPDAPMLAFSLTRGEDYLIKPHHYSFRRSDGSGLVINERFTERFGNDIVLHDVTIGETPDSSQYTRRFGDTSRRDPIVRGIDAQRFDTMTLGPDAAIDQLSSLTQKEGVANLLVGQHEIQAVLGSDEVYGTKRDILVGHAVLNRFHFNE